MALSWTPTIDHALQQAARAHEGQHRKSGGAPYISHPVAVTLLVSGYTADEEVIAAALLHDVLEDVPPEIYGATGIRRDFGPRVLELVRGVSEDKTAGRPQASWLERKRGYLTGLREAPLECVLISAADKLHNLRSLCTDLERLGTEVWDSFNASPSDTLWFQRAVSQVLRDRLGAHRATAELEEEVARLARLVERHGAIS